jgi:RNA polymerase sigma-70 factor, ECF subfamily
MRNSTFPVSLLDTGAFPARSPKPRPVLAISNVLALAQAGDHEAFAQLYALHQKRVFTICLRMMRNVSAAEDLTQEAFLQLHRKIAMFRGESAFTTWLHRLTVNVVLMHMRKKSFSLVSLDQLMDESSDERPTRAFGKVDTNLAGVVDRVAIQRAIDTLPDGYRNVFVLYDMEGFDHNEIAEMFHCSRGNTKSQLHKARRALRNVLSSRAPEVVSPLQSLRSA